MSVRVMSWVWESSRSSGVDRLVLLAIADCAADDGGRAWPSRTTLATKTGLGDKTVRRAVTRLVQMGELEVAQGGAQGGANLYRVLMGGGHSDPSGGSE